MNIHKVLLSLLAATTVTARGETSVIGRGPHHAVHQEVRSVIEKGRERFVTNRYTLLQTGLNYLSETENRWLPSTTEIELAQTGAEFKKGSFKLKFHPNHNTPGGPVEFTLPDGRIVKIQTVGLALTDKVSGDSVWLGEAKDSNGILIGNSVYYQDAFAGVKADIRVSVSIGKWESDVILREQILAPQVFGWNENDCSLEIFHKIVAGPEPVGRASVVRREDGSSDADEQLDFGDMMIGPGAAFLIGANQDPVASPHGHIRVTKERFRDPQTGVRWMIEKIPYSEAVGHLRTLPAREEARLDHPALKGRLHASRTDSKNGQRRKPVNIAYVDSARGKSTATPRQMAALAIGPISGGPGFLIDYTVLATATNFRLKGDTTYYVTNEVNLSGTTVIEPGVVVKFASGQTPKIQIHGGLDCQTSPYGPAVFTAKDDNSVGEIVTGSTGSPSGEYGQTHLYFSTVYTNSISVHDIRSRYGRYAVGFFGSAAHEVYNLQTLSSYVAVAGYGNTVQVRNALIEKASYAMQASTHNTTFGGDHVTAHKIGKLLNPDGKTNVTLSITNSLIAIATNTSSGVTSTASTTVTSDSGVFQTVKAGTHYLADDTYRSSAGTVPDAIQRILKNCTTYAPIELTNSISVDTVLFPAVVRDGLASSGGAIGYHYPALDYLVSDLVITNATLTLSNGVAVAGHGGSIFKLQGSGKLISHGRPERMNVIATIDVVQEQPSSYVTNLSTFIDGHSMDLRFTEVSTLAVDNGDRLFGYGDYAGQAKIRDSVMRNLGWQVYNYDNSQTSEALLLNIVFDRCVVALGQETSSMFYLDAQVRNNLFLGGEFAILHYGADMGLMEIKDNFFDQGTLTYYENAVTPFPYGAALTGGNNAYSGTNAVFGGSGNKTSIAASYETGPLGKYYYPTSGGANSLTNLINTGSVNDAGLAGLYHFTTVTNSTELNSALDIGHHYAAVDANGNPVDTDGDTIPDYLEDENGDGSAAGDATSWLNYSSPGTLTGNPGLQTYTPLKQ